MGNNASAQAESIVTQSFAELKKSRAQDEAWLSLEPRISSFSDHELTPIADFPEAFELQDSFNEKPAPSINSAIYSEIAYAVPLPHSESEKLLEDAIAKLQTTVQTHASVADFKNQTAKSLNGLVKGHLALQRSRERERRSTEEAAQEGNSDLLTSPQISLGSVPLVWILSSPSLIEGDVGQTFFTLVNQTVAAGAVGALANSDLKDAKDVLLGLLKTQAQKSPAVLPTLLGVALGYGSLPGVLTTVISLLKPDVQERDLLSLKPLLHPLFVYEANPNPQNLTAHFGGNSHATVSANGKTVTYDGQNGQVTSYIKEKFQEGTFYLEFLMETSTAFVDVCDGHFIYSSQDDLNYHRMRYRNNGNIEYKGNSDSFGSFDKGDVIGIHLNFIEKLVAFYKNKTKVGEKPLPFAAVRLGVVFSNAAQVSIGGSFELPAGVAPGTTLLRQVQPQSHEIEFSADQKQLGLRAALLITHSLGAAAKKLSSLLDKVVDLPKYLKTYGLVIDVRKEVLEQLFSILVQLKAIHGVVEDALKSAVLSALTAVVKLLQLQLIVASKMHLTRQFAEDAELVDRSYSLLTVDLVSLGDASLSALVTETVGGSLDIFLSNEGTRLNYILDLLKKEDTIGKTYGHLSQFTLIDPMLGKLPIDSLKTFQVALVSKTLRSNDPGLQQFFWAYVHLLFSNLSFTDKDRLLPLGLHLLSQINSTVRDIIRGGAVTALLWNAEHLNLLFLTISLCQFDLETLVSVYQPLLEILDAVSGVKKTDVGDVVETKESVETVTGTKEVTFKTRASLRIGVTKKELLTADTKIEVVTPTATVTYGLEELVAGVTVQSSKNPTVKITYAGEEGAAIEIRVFRQEKIKNFFKPRIAFLRDSLSYTLLKLSSTLISNSFKAPETNDEEIKKALNNPIISAGIKDNAWIFIGETVSVPQSLVNLAEPLLLEEELEAGPEGPNLGRSMSLMTEKENKASIPAQTQLPTDLSSYLGFLGRATQLPFLVEQSVFLESLIEGKGSPGQLWTHVHKLLGLDKKPYSKMGGSACDKAERMVLAVLIKFSDLRKDVERLSLDITEVPANLGDLWKKSNVIRAHLVQKQQEENIEEAANRIVKLGILLLNSEFKASLSALGFTGEQENAHRRRKSVEMPTFSKAQSLIIESKEKAQALVMLKRLKKGYHADVTQSHPGSLPELILDFLKSNVNIAALGKEIKVRRENAISRVIGLGMLHFLQKKPKVQSLVAKQFALIMNQKHFLGGLGGIDPALQECLRKYFFKIYNACCEEFLAIVSNEAISQKSLTDATLNHTLAAIAYPFKPSDFSSLTNLQLQSTLKHLLSVAKGSAKVYRKEFNQGAAVITNIKPGEEGAKFAFVKKENSKKWVTSAKVAETEPGWKKVDVNLGTAEAPKYLFVLRGRNPVYVTDVTVSPEGEVKITTKTRAELTQRVDVALPNDLKWICWNLIKLFIHCLIQAKGAEATSSATVKFTEVVLHSIYEELDASFEVQEDSGEVFAIIKGEGWLPSKQEPSPALKLVQELEEATREKAPELNAIAKKFLKWDAKGTARPIPVETIRKLDAEAPEFLPQWLDSQQNFDIVLFFKAAKDGFGVEKLSEESRKFIADSELIKKLPSALSDVDNKLPKRTESEKFALSMLWLLFITSNSETALKIMRSSDYLKLLLDAAFSRKNSSLNALAFRVLEHIMPTLDRVELLDAALSPSVKEDIAVALESPYATQSFLHLATALASILLSRALGWTKKPSTDIEHLVPAGDCCRRLLISALRASHWRTAFVKMIAESVDKVQSAARDETNGQLVEEFSHVLGAYHVLTGALSLAEPLESEVFTLLKQVQAPNKAGLDLVTYSKSQVPSIFQYESKDITQVDLNSTSTSGLLTTDAWEDGLQTQFNNLLFTLIATQNAFNQRTLENTRVVNVHRGFWNVLTNSVYSFLALIPADKYDSEAAVIAIKTILSDLKRVPIAEENLKKMREVLVKQIKGKAEAQKEEPVVEKQIRRRRSVQSPSMSPLGSLFDSDAEEVPPESLGEAAEEVKEEEKKEEKKEEVKTEALVCLYRLQKLPQSPFIPVSGFSQSDFTENELGHPTITSKHPAHMDLNFTHELFRNVSDPSTLNGLTVFVALGPTDGEVTGTFGFRLGELNVEVSRKPDDLLEGNVWAGEDRKVISSAVQNGTTLGFKVHLLLNGQVTVKLFGEEQSVVSIGPLAKPIFTGFSLSSFTFYTRSQASLTLRGLVIYQDIVKSETKFWTEVPLDTVPKPLATRIATVSIKTDTTDISEVLAITGAGPALETEAISHGQSWTESLNYLLYHTDAGTWSHPQKLEYLDYPIVDVKLFYRIEDVPKSYEVAKYWKDGKLIGPASQELSPGRKIIAFLKRPMADRENWVEGLTIIPKVQEMNNYTYVGNLTIGEGETSEPDLSQVVGNGLQSLLYITRKPASKIPTNFITDISVLETSSTSSINTPRGYVPVPYFTKDTDSSKANVSVLNLDLTPQTARVVALAISTTSNVFGFPARSLATAAGGKEVKFTGGMVDAYEDSGKTEDSAGDIKDFENDLKNWSKFEMQCELKSIEEQLRHLKSVSVLQQLASRHAHALSSSLTTREVLSTFLSVAVQKAKPLPAVFAQMLSSGSEDLSVLRKNIILEIALQLYLHASQEKVVNLMPTRLIESIHPYENNMNVQDVISIPGATSLLIEFDPQTKTESGCDPLRFYKRPGNVEEICVYSGEFANFKPLEIEGDTVYLKFTSDGSVVYWGYKFTVTPKSRSKPKATVRAPDYRDMNPEAMLWLLENYQGWNLGPDKEKITSSVILNAAGIVMHNLNGEQQSHMITVFQGLMQAAGTRDIPTIRGKTVEENLDQFVSVLESDQKRACDSQWMKVLAREAKDLYAIEESQPDVSAKMKAIAELLASTSRQEEWLKYSQTVFALEGLISTGAKYYALLLSYAQAQGLVSLDHVEETEPHYSKAEVIKKVQLPGAHSLNVSIDEKVSVEPHHSVAISQDEELTRLCYSSTEKMVETPVFFSSAQKGQNFVLTKDNRSIEYTNSSWQTIVVDKEMRPDQKVFIEFHIEQCSDFDNIAVGIHEVQASYACNNCGLPGNGFATKSWSLRGNGEFYSPSSTNINQRMSEGCKVAVEGDLKSKQFYFLLNGKRVGTLQIDTPRIMFNLTSYNNCKVTISKFLESVVLNSEFAGRDYTVPSDTFYYAFPVNRAYDDWQILSFRPPFDRLNINVQFTCPEFTGLFQRVQLDPKLQHGKLLITMKVIDLANSLMEFGVSEGSEALDTSMMVSSSYALSSNADINFAGQKATATRGFRNGDTVGFLIDSERKKIVFLVNGEEVGAGDFQLGPKMFISACCQAKGQRLMFIKEAPALSLLHLDESGKSKKNGLKLIVKPVIAGMEGLLLAKRLSEKDRATFLSFLATHTRFTKDADSDLCSYVDAAAKKLSTKCSDLKPTALTAEKEEMLQYPMLEPFSVEDLRSRFSLILHINNLFSSSFKLVDLTLPSNLDKATRMQTVVVNCREYLFYDLKHEMLQNIMRATHCDSRTDISINRMRANTLMLKGVKDVNNQVSVFAQAMKILNPWAHRNLRNAERIFTVNLVAESAGDAGGPYNEVITTISEELMSDFVTLFVKSPNNVQNIGTNRDTYTINPDATSSRQQEMYLFLGKMFGVAIRTQNNMHLFLPPLFWKKLMLAPVGLIDLKGVDESVYQAIEMLRNPAGKNVDEEQFKAILDDFTFTTKNSAGTTVDLKPSGSSIPVSPSNVLEYTNLIERYRLTENDLAYLEIRKGMSAVIPLDILNLLSWSQVESLVCGAPTWDVERVKSNTHYEGYSASDQVVQNFWTVVSEFTREQKVLFLRFAWGRSRLPAAGSFKNFQLTKMDKNDPDHALPAAHTCFFTIDLPPYTTVNVLRERLVFAVTHCQAYDIDHLPDEIDQGEGNEEQEEED